jgi:hypothetical protein
LRLAYRQAQHQKCRHKLRGSGQPPMTDRRTHFFSPLFTSEILNSGLQLKIMVCSLLTLVNIFIAGFEFYGF